MKIKDHPKIKYGNRSWTAPPGMSRSGSAHPTDIEEPTLTKAAYSPEYNDTPGHISVETDYKGQRITAQYGIDDKDFAEKLCQKLNADCVGKTIKEIGEIEIDL